MTPGGLVVRWWRCVRRWVLGGLGWDGIFDGVCFVVNLDWLGTLEVT